MKTKLYHCCNTCIYQDNSFYGCSKASECYNGFSAYSPNAEMKAADLKAIAEKEQEETE